MNATLDSILQHCIPAFMENSYYYKVSDEGEPDKFRACIRIDGEDYFDTRVRCDSREEAINLLEATLKDKLAFSIFSHRRRDEE